MAPTVTNGVHQNDIKKYSRVYAESDGDEIVISGMSGRFPNSRNIAEYEYNLYNKVDMVDEDERRWKHFNVEIPKRCGKIYDLEKFDATFFGVHFKQAHTMDPQCRILIEAAYEAVLDAGINPKSLRNTRTGVYVGGCLSESEKTWFYEKISSGGFGITGCSRAMLANRISYILGLHGPSYLVDTACSSSMYALDNAFSAFRNGEIDAAIIGGSNLILHPYVTLQFARLGVLANNGFCRPFDQDATGYTRSEAVNCLFLQRKRDAKRIYATLVYSKTNCDGYKSEGITYPSGIMQEKLLREFYEDIDINPNKLGFVEAHSTGTVVGDPEECRALDNVLCKDRKDPLMVGSVKSNIGHSEAASGICSLVKAILAFQNGMIPPNINFRAVRKEIPSLAEGRLDVVDDPKPLKSPYIGVNSFGFGGANAHALLKACEKEKINFGIPKDRLPRLVTWAGRSEEGVNVMFNEIESKPLDAELVGLLHSIQSEPISGLVFRGFALYADDNGKNALCLSREVQHYTGIKRPIVWVFSGMGSQWLEMGASMMEIPSFRESIEKCHKVLKPKGMDLINILTSSDPTTFDNILNSFVGIAAIQIGIVDILRLLNFEPDHIIGHSVGELGCGYADGGLTAEQMILCAYSRGKVSLEIEKIHGSMAAVGLGYKNIVKMLPPTIEVACHNGPDSSTISGPSEDVAKFVKDLKNKGIFAKEVPCSNIAYHSRYIAHMGPLLLKYLREIVPEPKPRTTKWLSSSVPKSQWENPGSQLCSAEYHTNNLLSSVLFEETSAMLPPNALTIEIAPHGLLQAILRKSMPNAVHIGLTQRGNQNNVQYFFTALGRLYLNGADLPIDRLYPPIQFPVSRGTPTISSLIKWDHSEDWFVTKFENIKSDSSGERTFKIGLMSDDDEYLTGHIIDGRVLVPATGYLQLVWETFSLMRKGPVFMDMAVEFEDVRFLRATHLQADTSVILTVMIHYGTGQFEITESGALIVTGTISEVTNPQPPAPISPPPPSKFPIVTKRDFYKELRLRGYHYMGAFRAVQEARGDGLCGKVKWDYNWVSFMDCLLQIHILGTDSRSLMLPTRIRKLRINGKHHIGMISDIAPENQVFDVQICHKTNRLVAGGIEIIELHASPVARRKPPGIPVLEKYEFVPSLPSPKLIKSDALRVVVQILLENNAIHKIKAIEVDFDNNEPVIQFVQEALEDLPVVSGDLMLLTKQELNLPGVHVEDGKLSTQTNCALVITSKVFEREEFIDQVQKSMSDNAYLLSRESIDFDVHTVQSASGFHTIAILPSDDEVFVLMQRIKKKYYGHPTVVEVRNDDNEYSWLETAKTSISKGPVVIVAQNENLSGILGLVNCLRKEPDGQLVTCVWIDDKDAPPFDLEHAFYKNQLKLGLAINIYKNGEWGTYRHLQLLQNIEPEPQKNHIYANMLQRGDLSSLSWLQGPLSEKKYNVKIVYASLNFRDIMLATGRLASEIYGQNRLDQLCVLGFEMSGIDLITGKRCMGMVNNGATASHTLMDNKLIWDVPDDWSLKEAATMPVVYLTVYWAFFFTTDIRQGKSILIHAGSGGIGIAAIRVALAYGLEVYTTVGTPQKKQFVLDMFPQIKESHIGNTRDTSFEQMIHTQTGGKGVDFVLNSLAEDKLLASIRCLAHGGHFLEIGKFDMANDNKIGLGMFLKELSFHAVLADNLFKASMDLLKKLKAMIYRDIAAGIIKPLPTTVFKINEIEQAFRYMATGKHMGKVLLEVRENAEADYTHPVKVLPQVYFDPSLVYVIPGGLGGFGLELTDWMAIRGARKFVLSSSRGITKPYQEYRIRLWETYGATVLVDTSDISTREGCKALIEQASKIGPVGGIFNLAVALRDAIFSNQNSQKFMESFAPKAIATKYLDEISRKMCPQMTHFVVFSSVSCGRGNAGQTNYGMANSIMERIIEDRAAQGLPAKAIQWGAVGEVGLVADMAEDKIDMEISGTLQQRISSCLQELDKLMTNTEPIVSSMVVAEKRSGRGGQENIIETVMNIMSIRDLKSISMGTTLSEMGMDSLMAVEIKQTLEREFELFLTPQDLRSLTFQKLQELSDAREKDSGEGVKLKLANEDKAMGMAVLLRSLGDEITSDKTILPLITKNSNVMGLNNSLIIPGLEGVAGQVWHNIALSLHSHSYMLQLFKTGALISVEDIAKSLYGEAKQVFKKSEPFYLIGYSFGSTVTLQIANFLEEEGYFGHVLLIDGAPQFLKKIFTGHLDENFDEDELQVLLFTTVVHQFFPEEASDNIAAQFMVFKGWDAKMDKFMEYADKQKVYSKEYGIIMMQALYNRIRIISKLDSSNFKPINSSITLIRPSEVSVVDIDEDYGLSELTKGKVNIKFIEGNHTTMLENPSLPQLINDADPNIESDKSFEVYLNH